MSVFVKDPSSSPKACIIWMHGLGADASDMAGLADQLGLDDTLAVRHLFIDAPLRPITLNNGMVMRAWYDIVSVDLCNQVDLAGIAHSTQLIQKLIESQLNEGLDASQIFLAGFSQGGVMAILAALQCDTRLGGVIALSSYLPMQETTKTLLDKHTPFFIALGLYDQLVLPKWTLISKEWLVENGYDRVTFNQYPMEHSICNEQVKDINRWLTQQIQGGKNDHC